MVIINQNGDRVLNVTLLKQWLNRYLATAYYFTISHMACTWHQWKWKINSRWIWLLHFENIEI